MSYSVKTNLRGVMPCLVKHDLDAACQQDSTQLVTYSLDYNELVCSAIVAMASVCLQVFVNARAEAIAAYTHVIYSFVIHVCTIK